jgi:putative flippase GtrA
MTLPAIQNVLAEICRKEGKSVEISFHPGEALPGELDEWKGDTAWHFSLWRRKERELIQNAKLKTLLESFSEDKFVHPSSPALEVFRFFISGSTAAATNLILLYIFTSLLGIWYIASLVIAYAIAIIVSFSLQKFWTFSHYSLERTRSEIMWYILNNILGLSFNAVLLYILVEYVGLWYMYAQFIPLVILSIWNFFVFRFFIFPKPKSIDEN